MTYTQHNHTENFHFLKYKELDGVINTKEINIVYSRFLNKEIKEVMGFNRIVYQRIPTLIEFLGGEPNGSIYHHIERYSYTLIVALSNCYDFNTLWTTVGEKPVPINLSLGQYCIISAKNDLFFRPGKMSGKSSLLTGQIIEHMVYKKYREEPIGGYYSLV